MNITNDKVTEYINKYYFPIDSEMLTFREWAEDHSIPIILRETEMYLGLILKIIKPEHILEIGTAVGYSAIYFARLLENAQITTIDRHPKMIPIAEENFTKWPEGRRINFKEGEALDIMDEMIKHAEASPNDFNAFDFVFIDASKSHYKEFFERAEKLVSRDAVIICDNIFMKAYLVDDKEYDPGRRHRTSVKRMQEFIDYLYERKDITVSLLSDGDGLAVIKFNE